MIGFRSLCAGMAVHVAVLAATPLLAAGADGGGAGLKACCRVGHAATCPMGDHTAASAAAAQPDHNRSGYSNLSDHNTCRLCCCTPTGVVMLPVGLVSLVIPHLIVQPPSAAVTMLIDYRHTPLDLAHAPPGPPPKSLTTPYSL